MKKFSLLLLAFIPIINININSQSYYEQNQFGLTSPGAMKYGLYGYNNPAVLAFVESPDLLFAWSDQYGNWNNFNQWGLFAAVPHFSFAVVNQKITGYSLTDYKISTGFGSTSFTIGFGYGWSTGDLLRFSRSDLFTIGTLIRPNRYLSVGFTGNILPDGENEGIIEAAVRPFGNEFISLFGDYVLGHNDVSGFNKWSAGAAIEALPGIRVTGRYFENKFFNVGTQLSFGRAGVFSQASFNEDGKHLNNIYGIRIGAYDRHPFENISPANNYIDMNLIGDVKYQRYKWFDKTNTLRDLLEQIEAAAHDNSIAGLAINTSGMNINREMIWELREKFLEFRGAGKKIVVYIDRAAISDYYLASAADKIVMDPLGAISLEGYLLGRQYYAGTLEKLGIGFTELRYFKYKSAAETFAGKEMSEADEEQWQAIIDDIYELSKKDICSARNISPEKFEELVNETALFMPQDALENNLVDTLGRWDTVTEIIKQLEGEERNLIGAGSLAKFNLPGDNYWGEKPAIAIIYALGVCAMDEGINARSLSKDVKNAADDDNVKAIVFRVDSPGGDALASDLVAEELRKAKEKKPVIVSQGYVAGSGGYWLSMYGDTILAAPNTITGSIGVIGAWYYNKGLKEDLGVSTDFVKRGNYADFGFGMAIPFIGISLPDRDLNANEKEKAEKIIKGSYDDFVSKVTMGRNRTREQIEEVAQGRVWSGVDGLQNGLVDIIGGLDDAIKIAEEKAGLKNKVYEIFEYPEPPLINFSDFLPSPFGIELKESALIKNLKFRMKNNGMPMPLMQVDFEHIP